MGMKRVYAQMGGGRFMEDMLPRKRANVGPSPIRRPPAPTPAASSPARRVLRANRTPYAMDVEPASQERKRSLPEAAEPGSKRVRASKQAKASAPPRRTRRARDEAASRERARRTAPSEHRHHVAAAVAQAMQDRAAAPRPTPTPMQPTPMQPPLSHYRPHSRAHPQPAPEHIEEVHIDNLQQEAPLNAPSVQAALLADGRCAVRIVREDGVVQGVIIHPPMMY